MGGDLRGEAIVGGGLGVAGGKRGVGARWSPSWIVLVSGAVGARGNVTQLDCSRFG